KPFIIISRVLALLLVLFVTNLFIGSAGIIFGLVFAVLLFVIPTYSSERVSKIIFQSIGLTSCLYTLLDIKSDLLTTKYRLTDAQLLANDTSVPAVYWGILWILVSGVIIYLMVVKKYSPLWKKSRR
ncbi:MAG: M50 family metallopeptidase, partial [Ignavibacterium sp.]|nr:M50 family metallopeptidase [Ignavibacterium sp.]